MHEGATAMKKITKVLIAKQLIRDRGFKVVKVTSREAHKKFQSQAMRRAKKMSA